MHTEMGEYFVGAYLKLIMKCNAVEYNVRRQGGGIPGLKEIDVIGFDFKNKIVYICEVTTHLDSLLYKNKSTTITKIKEKYENLCNYAKTDLPEFVIPHFIFWSPIVTSGVARELQLIKGLELKINEQYTNCIVELEELAKSVTYDSGNPAFRALQILGHLRRKPKIDEVKKTNKFVLRTKTVKGSYRKLTNHEMIAQAFKNKVGKTFETHKIKRILLEKFPDMNEGSMQPNDHAKGNKSACWCANTKDRIFDKISRGQYKVRQV